VVGRPGPNKGKAFSRQTKRKMREAAYRRIKRDGAKIFSFPGEKNGNAKITEEDAAEIRSLHAAGGIGYGLLGKQFGLSKSQIRAIIKGLAWKT